MTRRPTSGNGSADAGRPDPWSSDGMSVTRTGEKGPPVDTDPRRWWGLVVIALAQLMVVLDATIVNIALPSAQRDLGMSDGNRQWVITAYTLAFGGLLLLGGRIADLVGRKRTFVIGLVGFAAASALGGAATNAGMLFGARALQGAFAAVLAPSALSLLTTTFTDPKERGKAFGIYGALAGSGAAIGFMVGGLLTEYLDWRWCLYVNVPIAIVAVFGALALLHDRPGHAGARLDVPGVCSAAAASSRSSTASARPSPGAGPTRWCWRCSPRASSCSRCSCGGSPGRPARCCRCTSSATATAPAAS